MGAPYQRKYLAQKHHHACRHKRHKPDSLEKGKCHGKLNGTEAVMYGRSQDSYQNSSQDSHVDCFHPQYYLKTFFRIHLFYGRKCFDHDSHTRQKCKIPHKSCKRGKLFFFIGQRKCKCDRINHGKIIHGNTSHIACQIHHILKSRIFQKRQPADDRGILQNRRNAHHERRCGNNCHWDQERPGNFLEKFQCAHAY